MAEYLVLTLFLDYPLFSYVPLVVAIPGLFVQLKLPQFDQFMKTFVNFLFHF